MSDLIGLSGDVKTPMGFADNSRPLVMVDADNIFKRLQFRLGGSASDAVTIASTVSGVLKDTKGSDITEVWTKLEKKLNGGKPIATKAKTDEAKLNTAYSLLYSALNVIDKTATSTAELGFMRDIYFDTDSHFLARFSSKMEGKDRRVSLRVSKTINERMNDMIESFNALIEEGQLAGPAL